MSRTVVLPQEADFGGQSVPVGGFAYYISPPSSARDLALCSLGSCLGPVEILDFRRLHIDTVLRRSKSAPALRSRISGRIRFTQLRRIKILASPHRACDFSKHFQFSVLRLRRPVRPPCARGIDLRVLCSHLLRAVLQILDRGTMAQKALGQMGVF